MVMVAIDQSAEGAVPRPPQSSYVDPKTNKKITHDKHQQDTAKHVCVYN
jgi:hypothetical protein